MEKRRYIERGGEQVYEQPFVAEGVQFFGFAVEADKNALGAICDRYLNGPSGTTDFVPAVSHVLFVFNRLAKMYAKNPPNHDWGWYSEQEGAIWMLVLDEARNNLFWFQPYMIVDSSYAMAMGREIYGFPKEIGWFNVPDGPGAPQSMGVETIVVEKLLPSCQARREPLFGARLASAADEEPSHKDHETLSDLAAHVASSLNIGRDFLDHLALTRNLFEDLIHTRIPMVFLKQIRDAVEPDRACFQAIQECETKMTALHGARVYFHKYEIDIGDFASHPIRQELGLAPGPVKADVAFWANFDFEIGACKEVWKAP